MGFILQQLEDLLSPDKTFSTVVYFSAWIEWELNIPYVFI